MNNKLRIKTFPLQRSRNTNQRLYRLFLRPHSFFCDWRTLWRQWITFNWIQVKLNLFSSVGNPSETFLETEGSERGTPAVFPFFKEKYECRICCHEIFPCVVVKKQLVLRFWLNALCTPRTFFSPCWYKMNFYEPTQLSRYLSLGCSLFLIRKYFFLIRQP